MNRWIEGRFPQSSLLYLRFCSQDLSRRVFTSESCLLIPFTLALNTWQNRNQGLPHAGHADPLAIGAKKSVHFQLYRSTRPLLGHSISSKCSHYHQTTLHVDWILSFDNDNDTSRNDFSDNTWISFRLSTHKYFDSFQFNNNHNPNEKTLTLSSNNHEKKNCYCWFHRMRMFSDTAVLVKTPSEWENISIIENNHVSPLKKESASCSGRIESGKPWARERNWKGGDAVLSCSVTVLDIKPLLRSKKSSYGLQTE